MYQQQQFDPALLSLMEVAKKVTPQGNPTVAAGIMQQAGVPPQAMPPGPPQEMPPPQDMPPPQQGLPGVLQQTQQAAPSVAQNMQEAQTQQMLAQAQPQPAMMAEGGIASLPVGMDEYADGGIVGYAGPDGSEVNFGGVSGIPYYGPGESEERERLNRLPLDVIEKLIEAMRVGGKRLVRGTTFDPLTKRTEESKEGKLFQNIDLINAAQAAQSEQAAPEAKAQPEVGAAMAAPARKDSSGIAGALPRQAPTGAEAMYLEQLKAIDEQRKGMRQPRTLDQIRQEELAARRARGLPEDPNEMAFKHLEETAALQQKIREAQLAKEGPERQDALLKGILAPGAMNLGQMFGNTAREIMGAEATQRGNVETRAKEDLVMKQAEPAIRAAIQKANYAELDGDMATAQAERDKAETIKQALFASQQTLTTGRRGEVATAEQGAFNRAAQERIAQIRELPRAKSEESRAAAMERYADNWEKLDPMQKMQLSKEGVTNFAQYVQMRDRMVGGATGAPASQPQYARNPKTGERIMSTDGGQTWKPAQ